MRRTMAKALLLVLASLVSAAQPVYVRDPFTDHRARVFIPADNDGVFWTRYDFHVPKEDRTNYGKYWVMDQVFYGRIYAGLASCMNGGAGWTESGAGWAGTSGAGWYYRNTAVQTAYAEILIPANYNRIHLLSYDVTGGDGATIAIAWDDTSTTGLDITAYDSGTATRAVEIVIAADAAPDGIKKLRFTNNDAAGMMRIIGIHAWNTHILGDPVTAVGGDADAWLGHDLVTDADSGASHRPRAINSEWTYNLAVKDSAHEFALKWAPDTSADKWVGGDQHFGDGQAEYVYHAAADYLTDGPTIFVDNTDAGGTWEIARNKLLFGDSIHVFSTGYSDYDEGATEGASEADLTWDYNFSQSGMSVVVSVIFAANSDVEVCYFPMLSMNSYGVTDRMLAWPTNTEYDLSTDRQLEGTAVMFLRQTEGCTVEIESYCPLEYLWWDESASKYYGYVYEEALVGGTDPPAGTVWTLGGFYRIRRMQAIENPRLRSRYNFRHQGQYVIR